MGPIASQEVMILTHRNDGRLASGGKSGDTEGWAGMVWETESKGFLKRLEGIGSKERKESKIIHILAWVGRFTF